MLTFLELKILSSLTKIVVKIKTKHAVPTKYLNCGTTFLEIEKSNIGSRIKKITIKNSFLNLVFLFKKKIGANNNSNKKFFSA